MRVQARTVCSLAAGFTRRPACAQAGAELDTGPQWPGFIPPGWQAPSYPPGQPSRTEHFWLD